jgi:hypothetical protein
MLYVSDFRHKVNIIKEISIVRKFPLTLLGYPFEKNLQLAADAKIDLAQLYTRLRKELLRITSWKRKACRKKS